MQESAIGTTLTQEQIDQKEIDNFFRIHPLDGSKSICIDEVRNAGRFFTEILYQVAPRCADRTAAIRKIREAVWTAVFAIASDQNLDTYMKLDGYDPKTQLAPIPETLKRDSYNLLQGWIEEEMKEFIGKSGLTSGDTAAQFVLRVLVQVRDEWVAENSTGSKKN